MAIKKIRVKNFKSFKDLEVELGNLNILIGGNASGKSNFIQIFKFLRDVRNFGLENAISMQGGVEYFRNMNVDPSENFSLEVIFDLNPSIRELLDVLPMEIEIKTRESIYRLIIKFDDIDKGFEIVEGEIVQKFSSVKLKTTGEDLGQREIVISVPKSGGALSFGSHLESFLKPPLEQPLKQEFDSMLPMVCLAILFPMYTALDGISIYDFDPKLPKKAIPIAGKAELEEDGSNLAIVLKNIIKNEDEKRMFSNLVTYLLPFVDDLDVERFLGKSLIFKLRETYSKQQYLPATFVSDGTINMIALIIALYFERKPLVIIEEPERNIHPHLISRVMNMMKEASEKKQIIVTTHNPEMVRHADPNDVLLVSRRDDGFSYIFKPSEKEDVKVFLESDMRLEDLYVDDLLEI